MKIRCVVIDDEAPALDKLRSYINRIPYLELVASFDNAVDATEYNLAKNGIDAVFADINMPDLNGLDFVDRLEAPRPLVVFTTAYPQYALESYRTGAVDYLLKPFSFEDFSRAAGRLVERTETVPDAKNMATDRTLFIKVDNRYLKLIPDDVEYIRGYGDYLRIYTHQRHNPLVTYSTLSAIKSQLPADFLQIHRSYIVNMVNGVIAVERSRVITTSETEIPVGESYREALAEYLSARSIGKDTKRSSKS